MSTVMREVLLVVESSLVLRTLLAMPPATSVNFSRFTYF